MDVVEINKRFLEYKPLLWRVLSKLAHDGYAVLPQDAQDLIQDFFLEWESLHSRFDEEKGAFAPYLATSFYRFCRRRHIQLHRLRSRTVDLEALAEIPAHELSPAESTELKEQISLLREQLATLPRTEQLVLEEFLSDPAPGERELAQRFELTRYRLREVLGSAISRVALQMSDQHTHSEDARIAYRIWVEGQTPRFAATQLGLSTEQVQAAKTRFAQALLNLARSTTAATYHRSTKMSEIETLKKALHAAGDVAALQALRDNAELVRNALGSQDIGLDAEVVEKLNAHPEWLAEIYAALGVETRDESLVPQGYKALEVALADEHAEIAEAWSCLLEKLDDAKAPAALGKWESALQKIVETDEGFIRHLQKQESVLKGGPAAYRLVRYGLTPFMLFDALRSMELLFNRMLRPWRTPVGAIVRPSTNSIRLLAGKDVMVALERNALIGQIGGAFDIHERQQAPLVESIFFMLEQSPLLVNGYVFEGANTFRKQGRESMCTGFLESGQLVKRWAASGSDAANFRFH